jgi:class 3 adenylate cyclase
MDDSRHGCRSVGSVEDSFAARNGHPYLSGVSGRKEERVQRRNGHVLVVDDDAFNRRLLTATLAREGLRTTSATDGAEALTAIREDPPDVVLLDIEMPGIDGFEVLERIKGDEAVRHLPVIMISGLGDTESVVRCLEIGADDFLPKPFDVAILRARVNAGLDRKALHDLERERVRGLFTRFLPEPMVDEVLARSDGDARINPELLTGTVLFGDLRGFTSFAEGRPIDDVIEAINMYLTLMTDAVLDHGGTLVSYMGDGIMAAFGAPVASHEHADLALAAARAMAGEQLATFNAWLIAIAGVEEPIRMGIGINSGPVLSGSVGSPRRLDYTVIGDTVNTASRIESMTKELDRALLFSQPTRDALRELPTDAVPLGEFEIRGRSAKIELWALDVEVPT